jgi:hypothetical protein
MTIVVKLNGGLGNQLFQYAAGYAAKKIVGVDLKIDTTAYQHNENSNQISRNLDIKDFEITADVASNKEIKKLKYPKPITSRIVRIIRRNLLRKYYIDWHPEILNTLKNDAYLEGYFQSEKYFSKYIAEIMCEFKLQKEICDDIQIYTDDILNSGISVSLHVRRGDYISNSKVNSKYNICNLDYYNNAIAYFEKKYQKQNICFYLFSDDVEWLKNLEIKSRFKVISGGLSKKNEVLKPSSELYLMSQCNNQIISNSSFSWWAAYLNPQIDKIVVAPSRWVKSGVNFHKNIYPKGWVKLNV